MTPAQISSLGPQLADFLGEFDDWFGRSEPRGHRASYVRGQLSNRLPGRRNAVPLFAGDDASALATRLRQRSRQRTDGLGSPSGRPCGCGATAASSAPMGQGFQGHGFLSLSALNVETWPPILY